MSVTICGRLTKSSRSGYYMCSDSSRTDITMTKVSGNSKRRDKSNKYSAQNPRHSFTKALSNHSFAPAIFVPCVKASDGYAPSHAVYRRFISWRPMFIPLLANVRSVVNIAPQGNVFLLLLHFHHTNCYVPPIISLQIHHQWPNNILNLAPTTTEKKICDHNSKT